MPVEELDGELEVDGERVGVAAFVALEVGEDSALRRLAMLRPRYVMDDMAASASPASHSVNS